MFNWRKLRNSIPHFVQAGPKAVYEVVYIDEFKDGKTLGETRFDPRQIVIKNGLTPKLTVSVFFHEWFHCLSAEYNIGLTENQVLALEKTAYYWFKKGNLFKSENKNVRKKRRTKVRRRKTGSSIATKRSFRRSR